MCSFEEAKRDCQSDVIHFTTPESEDALNHEEVLHVQQENVPHKLKGMLCGILKSIEWGFL